MSVVFVTAIYKINSSAPIDDVWRNFSLMSNFFQFHIVCSAEDAIKAPANTIVHIKEFNELETFKIINKCTGLPRIRSEVKDTKEFMILMNAKTEFIKIVKDACGNSPTHYVWLDAGISKIFKNPIALYSSLTSKFKDLKTDKIFIPGCWSSVETRFDQILTKVHWHFSGGFFIVPASLVDLFYYNVLAGIEDIRVNSGLAIWEVNTWMYIESRLPIQWEHGDHDETIFNGLTNYGNSSL